MASFGAARNVHSTPSGGVGIGGGGTGAGTGSGHRGSTGGSGFFPNKGSTRSSSSESIITEESPEMIAFKEALKRAGFLLENGGVNLL